MKNKLLILFLLLPLTIFIFTSSKSYGGESGITAIGSYNGYLTSSYYGYTQSTALRIAPNTTATISNLLAHIRGLGIRNSASTGSGFYTIPFIHILYNSSTSSYAMFPNVVIWYNSNYAFMYFGVSDLIYTYSNAYLTIPTYNQYYNYIDNICYLKVQFTTNKISTTTFNTTRYANYVLFAPMQIINNDMYFILNVFDGLTSNVPNITAYDTNDVNFKISQYNDIVYMATGSYPDVDEVYLQSGINRVIDNPNNYGLYTGFQYENYGTERYSRGYSDGVNSNETNNFFTLFDAIFSAPLNYLRSLFNYTFFGINIFSFITGIISIAILAFVLRKLKGSNDS